MKEKIRTLIKEKPIFVIWAYRKQLKKRIEEVKKAIEMNKDGEMVRKLEKIREDTELSKLIKYYKKRKEKFEIEKNEELKVLKEEYEAV